MEYRERIAPTDGRFGLNRFLTRGFETLGNDRVYARIDGLDPSAAGVKQFDRRKGAIADHPPRIERRQVAGFGHPVRTSLASASPDRRGPNRPRP